MGATPERMTLTDLDTDETVEVMFNPSEIKRKVSVNYARKEVLGNSHNEHEYLYTGNQGLSFDLFYLAETPVELAKAEDAMRFLESLCYATENPESIAAAAPPRVLIVWPRTLTLTCRVVDVEFSHQRFNRYGNTVQWTAKITLDESRLRRLTKQDVRQQGALRTPQGVVDIDSEDPDIQTSDGPNGQVDLEGDIEIVFE